MDAPRWPLGTMLVFGFRPRPFPLQLSLATVLGASHVELYVNWQADPDPLRARDAVAGAGLVLHSVHSAWGVETAASSRIDLGSPVASVRASSVADVGRCLDWAAAAGAAHLVVHPGVMCDPQEGPVRQAALADSLRTLAERPAARQVCTCVENLPPGVWPGCRVDDLAAVIDAVHSDRVGLCLDTGHAHLVDGVAEAARSAAAALRTTHIHDNNGVRDRHLLPGYGTIDWVSARRALVEAGYRGVLMLECVAHFRDDPSVLCADLPPRLADLCRYPDPVPTDPA